MKLRHTQARKARTFNPRTYQNNGYYAMSVFWRRVNGCYGNDSKEFDLRYPNLEHAVEGYRSIVASRGSHRSKGEDQL